LTIEERLAAIGDKYGIVNILQDETLVYPVPEIKWCIWFILYNDHGYSYPRIAQLFAKYTHQGVQYGVKKINRLTIMGDLIIKKRIEILREELKECL